MKNKKIIKDIYKTTKIKLFCELQDIFDRCGFLIIVRFYDGKGKLKGHQIYKDNEIVVTRGIE